MISIKQKFFLYIFSGLLVFSQTSAFAYTAQEQQYQQAQQQRVEQERIAQEVRSIFNNGMNAFQNKDYYACINYLSRIESFAETIKTIILHLEKVFGNLKITTMPSNI